MQGTPRAVAALTMALALHCLALSTPVAYLSALSADPITAHSFFASPDRNRRCALQG